MFKGLLNEVGLEAHHVDHDAFTRQVLEEDILAESLTVQQHHRTLTIGHNGLDGFYKNKAAHLGQDTLRSLQSTIDA